MTVVIVYIQLILSIGSYVKQKIYTTSKKKQENKFTLHYFQT